MYDRVNTAIQEVFDAHGIDSPYPTHTMNLQVDRETAANLSEAFRKGSTNG
jgi:small-conductance mechanosensitive channel